MTVHHDPQRVNSGQVPRRALLKQAAAAGLLLPLLSWRNVAAQEVSCPPAASPVAAGTPVALDWKDHRGDGRLSLGPVLRRFQARAGGRRRSQFGFEYDLRDGKGDPATELANIQNFIAEGVDLILLTPMSEGTIPAIIQANQAGVPVIEVNNRAGFGSDRAEVVTYVGADDVEFGRLQAAIAGSDATAEARQDRLRDGHPWHLAADPARPGVQGGAGRSTPSTRSSPR